jgi:hypothetical protein
LIESIYYIHTIYNRYTSPHSQKVITGEVYKRVRYVRVVVVSRGTGTEAQGGSPLGEKIAGRKDFGDAILP